jgi:hypothetical protein
MSLTEKRIEEYRKKLRDSKYMEEAVNGIAERFSTGYAAVKLSRAEPGTDKTEEKEMAKNKLIDLNDHLFEQIEWLMDRDNIKGEDFTKEIRRTEAVVKAAAQIVNIANLCLKASSLAGNSGGEIKLPPMLEDKAKHK